MLRSKCNQALFSSGFCPVYSLFPSQHTLTRWKRTQTDPPRRNYQGGLERRALLLALTLLLAQGSVDIQMLSWKVISPSLILLLSSLLPHFLFLIPKLLVLEQQKRQQKRQSPPSWIKPGFPHHKAPTSLQKAYKWLKFGIDSQTVLEMTLNKRRLFPPPASKRMIYLSKLRIPEIFVIPAYNFPKQLLASVLGHLDTFWHFWRQVDTERWHQPAQ